VVTSSSIAWKASSLLGTVAALHLALTAPSRSTLAPDARARLARAVAASTRLSVTADDLLFERTRAVSLQDAVFGRALWFTGRARPGAPRDVYRAEIRLTPDGTLLGLSALSNLTRSPLGDDGPMVPESVASPDAPRRIAVPSRAFGQVQSAFVLDPAGDTATEARLRREVTNALETGSRVGVARYDLRLDRPADRVSLRFLSHDRVSLDAGRRAWTLDLRALSTEPSEGATLSRQQRVDKPPVIWAVDTVRSLPFVGLAPIAWLEQHAFAARDWWHQRVYRWFGRRPPPATVAEELSPDDAGRVIASEAGPARDPDWPPPVIAPPLGAADPGEGRWVNATPPWVRHLDGAPPAFYRTFVRLDDERPYTRVLLVAMDMRQLELGMQAGVEDPVPHVGPRGDGRIPRTPGLMPRVVGAFNGAFKTEHGAYGMAVDGRVLLPPQPGAATVVTLDDGRIAMGSWDTLPGLPAAVRSLRQNLEPLLADGVENPSRRGLWGFVLGGIETMPTVRSGLCADDRGHLFYAWGEETTARRLGRAMRLAGCTYGMHLDMNPTHATFHFLRVDDVAQRRFQHRALDGAMQSHGDRFLYYTLKDFFYLSLRPTLPAPVRGVAWTASRPQPPPSWMPGVTSLRVPLAPGREAAVEALAADRVRLHLRAGRREPATTLVAEDRTFTPSPERPLLGAIELGVAASLAEPRGLCVGGRVQLPFVAAEHAGHLALRDGAVSIEAGAAVAPEVREALQGVLVRHRGASTGWADAAVLPRQVLATTGDGRLLVVSGALSGDELAALLGDLGASEALLFERASGAAHWTGDEGLRDAWPESAVFIEGVPAASPVMRLEGWLRGQRGA